MPVQVRFPKTTRTFANSLVLLEVRQETATIVDKRFYLRRVCQVCQPRQPRFVRGISRLPTTGEIKVSIDVLTHGHDVFGVQHGFHPRVVLVFGTNNARGCGGRGVGGKQVEKLGQIRRFDVLPQKICRGLRVVGVVAVAVLITKSVQGT